MKTFLVGGAVRDKLMGLDPKDLDYVVEGASTQDMLDQGFAQVGADFPVFLHPVSGDEYALTRTERKSGHGYHGFTVEAENVTLEEDLMRRDLTVNAMAMDEGGNVVDPFGGQKDLENKVLRHVSKAFAEDPLRVLRVARFLARFGPEWSVHVDTKLLCLWLAEMGELDNLTAERVWKEMSRAMMEPNPELFFEFLLEVGALKVLFPEIHALASAKENPKWHPEGNAFAHTMLVLKQAVQHNADLELRLAALVHDLGKGNTPKDLMELGKHHGHENRGVYLVRDMMKRLGQGYKLSKRLEAVTRFHMHMHKLESLNPKTFVKMFNEMDALRDPSVVSMLYDLGCYDSRGRLGAENDSPYDHHKMLLQAFDAFKSVTFKDVFGDEVVKDGNKIRTRMEQARLVAMKEWKKSLAQ